MKKKIGESSKRPKFYRDELFQTVFNVRKEDNKRKQTMNIGDDPSKKAAKTKNIRVPTTSKKT